MDLETESKLLELKGVLNAISHISFSYSKLERSHPMHSLDNESSKIIIASYQKLIDNVVRLIKNYEREENSTT